MSINTIHELGQLHLIAIVLLSLITCTVQTTINCLSAMYDTIPNSIRFVVLSISSSSPNCQVNYMTMSIISDPIIDTNSIPGSTSTTVYSK